MKKALINNNNKKIISKCNPIMCDHTLRVSCEVGCVCAGTDADSLEAETKQQQGD